METQMEMKRGEEWIQHIVTLKNNRLKYRICPSAAMFDVFLF